MYLEDLGPKDSLVMKEIALGIDQQEPNEATYNDLQPLQPIVTLEKNDMMGDLEYKIIWELESWKKGEE